MEKWIILKVSIFSVKMEKSPPVLFTKCFLINRFSTAGTKYLRFETYRSFNPKSYIPARPGFSKSLKGQVSLF